MAQPDNKLIPVESVLWRVAKYFYVNDIYEFLYSLVRLYYTERRFLSILFPVFALFKNSNTLHLNKAIIP